MGLTTYDDEFLLAAIVIISMALIFLFRRGME